MAQIAWLSCWERTTRALSAAYNDPRWGRLLLALLALGVVGTGVLRFPQANLPGFGFTPQYVRIAQTTLESGRYSTRLGLFATPTETGAVIPETGREPLLPAVLAVAIRFGLPWRALVAFQCLLLAGALFMWLELGRTHFGLATSVLAAAFMTLSPVMRLYESVLYPYTFQFLMLSAASYCTICALERKRSIVLWALAGLFFGLACYERGSYLLLPVVVVIGLWALRHRYRFETERAVVMLVVFAGVIAPWLWHGLELGYVGMNAASGYSLGYQYGDLPPVRGESAFMVRYDAFVSRQGTDGGTLAFLDSEAASGRYSHQAADQELAKEIVQRMLAHPVDVARLLVDNVCHYAGRLVCGQPQIPSLFTPWPWDWYQSNVGSVLPSFADLAVLALCVLGFWVSLRPAPTFAVPCVLLVVYIALMSVGIVAFDPRYRGVSDAVIYLFAAQGTLTWARSLRASARAQA